MAMKMTLPDIEVRPLIHLLDDSARAPALDKEADRQHALAEVRFGLAVNDGVSSNAGRQAFSLAASAHPRLRL